MAKLNEITAVSNHVTIHAQLYDSYVDSARKSAGEYNPQRMRRWLLAEQAQQVKPVRSSKQRFAIDMAI